MPGLTWHVRQMALTDPSNLAAVEQLTREHLETPAKDRHDRQLAAALRAWAVDIAGIDGDDWERLSPMNRNIVDAAFERVDWIGLAREFIDRAVKIAALRQVIAGEEDNVDPDLLDRLDIGARVDDHELLGYPDQDAAHRRLAELEQGGEPASDPGPNPDHFEVFAELEVDWIGAAIYTDDAIYIPIALADGQVGYAVNSLRGDRQEFLYFNPSTGTDDGVPNVFVYLGPSGDPATDEPLHHYLVLEEDDDAEVGATATFTYRIDTHGEDGISPGSTTDLEQASGLLIQTAHDVLTERTGQRLAQRPAPDGFSDWDAWAAGMLANAGNHPGERQGWNLIGPPACGVGVTVERSDRG